MTSTDAFLAHHGIKGMRWGRRKPEDGNIPGPAGSGGSESVSGGSSRKAGGPAGGNQSVSLKQKKITEAQLRDYVAKRGGDPALLKAKYGPPETGGESQSFYQKHKTAINVGAGLVAAGAVAYGGYKLNDHIQGNKLAKKMAKEDAEFEAEVQANFKQKQKSKAEKAIDAEIAAHIANGKTEAEAVLAANAKVKLTQDYHATVAGKISKKFDFNDLDDEPVNLKAGHVVRRVSTEDEKSVRPGGFYASHDEADVSRYKAILPTYWKDWGLSATEGHVVNLRATKDVKSPSRKEAYLIHEKMISQSPGYRQMFDPTGVMSSQGSREFAQNSYLSLAATWATDTHPAVQAYFGEVKKQGYNALVDENDAGTLSKKPMRFLDGSMFAVEPSTRLSANDISNAQVEEARKLGLIDD